MKKLLLTGASGFLGWNLCSIPQNDWKITGIVNSNTIKIKGVNIIKADLADKKTIDDLFSQIKPDGVLHTAASTVPNYCQEHPQEAYKINVTASELLAQKCAALNIPMVFTSTDLVFDGKKGKYRETDPVSPVNAYGEQKAIAEKKILGIYPNTTICRMPLMIGDPGPVATNYLQDFITNARQGNEQKLFTDEFRSVLGGKSAAHGLFLALNKLKGIFHLGGRERMSRYALGQLIVNIFKISGAKLISTNLKDIQFFAPRSPNVTLDSTKAYKAGFDPMPLNDELNFMR